MLQATLLSQNRKHCNSKLFTQRSNYTSNMNYMRSFVTAQHYHAQVVSTVTLTKTIRSFITSWKLHI